jgi:hypothetical protein
MFSIRQCKCGSTEFEQEPDDCVLRCAKCWSLAGFSFIKEESEVEGE